MFLLTKYFVFRQSYFILLYRICQYQIAFYYIIIVIIYRAVIFMRPLKEKISITIDGDLLEALRNEAENDDRSLSQYINLILKEHLRKKEENLRPKEEK